MGREITEEERALVDKMVSKAKSAMVKIENWTQRDLDRLSQAIAWYAGNEKPSQGLPNRAWMKVALGIGLGAQEKDLKFTWSSGMFCAPHPPVLWKLMLRKD